MSVGAFGTKQYKRICFVLGLEKKKAERTGAGRDRKEAPPERRPLVGGLSYSSNGFLTLLILILLFCGFLSSCVSQGSSFSHYFFFLCSLLEMWVLVVMLFSCLFSSEVWIWDVLY